MTTETPATTTKTTKAKRGAYKRPAKKKKVSGYFLIEMRTTRNGTPPSRWYEVWRSDDGADCADYLKQCVLLDRKRSADQPQREYRMCFTARD